MDLRKAVESLSREKGVRRGFDSLHYKKKSNSYLREESEGNGGDKRIAHVAYHVANNAGDTALSKCVRGAFESVHKIKGWELISVAEPVTRETIDRINTCDGVVIGSGGLFLPDTNANNVSGWQWAISPELLDEIRVPMAVFSVGYNYFRGQYPSGLFVESLIQLVEKSSFVGMRNRGSIEAIKSLLPESLKEKVLYQPCTTTVIGKFNQAYVNNTFEKGKVALNLAFNREERRFGESKDEILRQISLGAKKIEELGYEIYCVCHCKDDDRFLPYLRDAGVKYILADLSRKYPKDIFDFYSRMDVVIGMRGHAQMIPFGLSRGIITLGSHDKMKWFLDDIDALDWYVDIMGKPDAIAERIVECFQVSHIKDKERTKERIHEAQNTLWEITKSNIDLLCF